MRYVSSDTTEYFRARDNLRKSGLLAIDTLKQYCLNRVIELRLATRAYKYSFSFSSKPGAMTSWARLKDLINREILKRIPYLALEENSFLKVNPSATTLAFVVKDTPSVRRYLLRIKRNALDKGIPLSINMGNGETWGFQNSLVVSINYLNQRQDNNYINGVLIIYYLPQILKTIETLHRRGVDV